MKIVRLIGAGLVLSLGGVIAAVDAKALSEYGLSCDQNRKCRACRKNPDCVDCLNACYNMYGSPDSVNLSGMTREVFCKKKQSKWCAAQCWDPDNTKVPDYVSTKPACATAY